jgi:signal transduction histidine kinase
MAFRLPHRGLVLKYVILLAALAGAAVLGEGMVQLYFTNRDTRHAVSDVERERATTVAAGVDQFVNQELSRISARTSGHMSRTERISAFRAVLNDDQRIVTLNYVRPVRRGIKALRVPRNGPAVEGSGRDGGGTLLLAAVRARTRGKAVVFRPDSELPTGRRRAILVTPVPSAAPDPGTVVAELNLTQLDDILSAQVAGGPQFAYYVVDRRGRLVAASVGSPVPATPLAYAALPQVRSALAHDANTSQDAGAADGRTLEQRRVFSSHQPVHAFGGLVFVEEGRDVALAPVWAAVWRTVALFGLFVAIAVLAGLLLARRMVRPIRSIQRGAARIGEGALDERLEVRTGDELEALADEVNRMAGRLGESYATLEERVAERTRELREALRQLKAASDHRSRFFAGVSHELRTPLNAIIGFSQVLRARAHGQLNPTQAECAEEIHASGRHLLAVIDDILDLAKIEAGRMELRITPFDLGPCLEGCLGIVGEAAERSGVTLAVEVAPDVGVVEADERKLRQVLLNLLANAIKFTPAGGSVTVRADRVAGEVRVAVQDTGVGIASEHQERIFDDFQQVGAGAAEPGTGLGLPLSRRLVELHGGRLWVTSRPGGGSTFTFSLPLRAENATPSPVSLGGGG